MMRIFRVIGWFVSLLALAVIPVSGYSAIPADKKVVGYLPDYRLDALPSINFGNVTHVCYFSLDADINGNLIVGSSFQAGIPAVVAKVHGAGKKVSVCVGGWLTDAYFSPIANSATARANFINQLVAYCRNNGLDGVDLDWEPVATTDVAAYSTLIVQLKTALAPYGLLLSVAVNWKRYDIQATAAASLDWVSVMTYDMNWAHPDHATYADTVSAMTFWAQSGIDKSKLLMGVPFYGLDEGWVNDLMYSEIVDLYNPGPDVNSIGGFGFNGLTLIKAKTAYALSAGFGGMMIWELGQDKYDSRSLLTALATAMGQEVVPALPAPWQSADIGSVGLVGSATQSAGTYTVSGAGYGIGGRADDFRYVYQTLTGDGEIKARVLSQSAVGVDACAGVMIRESVKNDARFIMMNVTPGNKFTCQVRASTGGTASTYAAGAMNAAPNNWVRIVRSGKTVTAYKSINGTAWTKVRSTTVSMASSITIGLVVTSANTAVLNQGVFDQITVVP
jgi:regulation of enolase protein 1 (concanavalin A-like superfamily)